jgi:phage gpG-like protein
MLTVTIALDPAGRALIARLETAAPRLQSALLAAIDDENQSTIGVITNLRLSRRGPDTLGVRTNRLRSSITATKAILVPGGTITATIGSNVIYAGVHEFGINKTVRVRAHDRTLNRLFGRRVTPFKQSVRAHDRRMVFPARAYIRRTLEERAPRYAALIGRLAMTALNPQ